MCARAFAPPTAYARQLLKDMKNVKSFAHEQGCDLPLIETAAAQYDAYVSAGNEMKDSASVSLLYARPSRSA